MKATCFFLKATFSGSECVDIDHRVFFLREADGDDRVDKNALSGN